MANISLCLIVRDEESNLPTCLRHFAPLADEIIVVDTGSTDDSVRIATDSGARVHEVTWQDDFSFARNLAIEQAQGDWILFPDADEQIDEANARKLQQLVHTNDKEVCAYLFLIESPNSHGNQTLINQHVRLFRNNLNLRYEYRVHENLASSISACGRQLRYADIVTQHSGYLEEATVQYKLRRNWRLLQMDLRDRPEDTFCLLCAGGTLVDMGKPSEALIYLQRCVVNVREDDPKHGKAVALLVRALRNSRQLQWAWRQGREGLLRWEKHPEILFEHGLTCEALSKYGEAEHAFRTILTDADARLLGSMPFDSGMLGYKTRHNLGVVLWKQSKQEEALREWQSALSENPQHHPTLDVLANVRTMQPVAKWFKRP